MSMKIEELTTLCNELEYKRNGYSVVMNDMKYKFNMDVPKVIVDEWLSTCEQITKIKSMLELGNKIQEIKNMSTEELIKNGILENEIQEIKNMSTEELIKNGIVERCENRLFLDAINNSEMYRDLLVF